MKGLSDAVSTQPVPPPMTAAAQCGKLLDFDPVELVGWIEGDDGGIYGFSAADVVDEKDIAIGDAVCFHAVGETASNLRGAVDETLRIPRELSGQLLSYDVASLTGWIGVEGEDVYVFTAADVVGDAELTAGQSVTFLGVGERATGILPIAAAPTETLRGHLLSYDAIESCGWIRSEDDRLFAFTAADVADDGEVANGQAVSFCAQGDRASDVLVLSTLPARRVEGRLLSYDGSDLRGWITGDDSNLYSFTAGEVMGEDEIEPGQRVEFLATDEQATQVRSLPAATYLTLRGTLLSYDADALCGWIVDEEANLYGFSADAVQGDAEITVGQTVIFEGESEHAIEVRAAESASPGTSLAGTLTLYDASDLTGWISGEDGNVYGFSAGDLQEDADIAAGAAVRFVADAERAIRVSAVPEVPVQAMEGTLLSYDATELRGWITGDDGNLYAFSVVDVVGQDELAPGQRVEFSGSEDRAREVRAASVAPEGSQPLEGKLLTYDAGELCGWVQADDGHLYGFAASDLLDNEEIAPDQRLSFRGAGDRAIAVRAIAVAPAQSLEGTLQAYGATDLIGLIRGADGHLYEFGGADVIGEEEIEPGRVVTFVSRGDRATEVCAAPILPARSLLGSLVSYDATELSGWISGEDGALYNFTAADVVGDEGIEVGQAVAFSGAGERASEVRAHGARAAEPQAMQGKLMSYDPAELCGWIEGDDDKLYAFAAQDVVGDEEITAGQAVTFKGADERAVEVRTAEPLAPPKTMRGKLLSYSPEALEGWISGEDRATYRFDGGDVLGDAEIRRGQSVSFVAIGKRATQVAEIEPAPLVAPTAPPRVPIAEDVPARRTALPEATAEMTSRSRMAWLFAAAVLVVGIGAVAATRLLRENSAPAPADVATSVPPPAAVATTEEAIPRPAPLATEPAPVSGTAQSVLMEATSEPIPVQEAAPSEVAVATPAPVAEPVSPKPVAVAATATQMQAPPPAASAPSPTTGVASVAPKPAAVAAASNTSAAPAPRPSSASVADAAASRPAAWWEASAPGQLNVVYVGRVAELSAIALMFDGDLRSIQAVNEHVRVTRADGTPVEARWALGRNPRMVLLPARPGRYEVSVGAGLADASGRMVKTTQQGPVLVE